MESESCEPGRYRQQNVKLSILSPAINAQCRPSQPLLVGLHARSGEGCNRLDEYPSRSVAVAPLRELVCQRRTILTARPALLLRRRL